MVDRYVSSLIVQKLTDFFKKERKGTVVFGKSKYFVQKLSAWCFFAGQTWFCPLWYTIIAD